MSQEHSFLQMINNPNLYFDSIDEFKNQLVSFSSAMATAIDERTPYNGSHTRKVVYYAGLMADYINYMNDHWECEDEFDDERKEALLLAASLHDIGKMIVPLNVMDKSTRLEGRIDAIYERFRLLHAYNKIDMLSGNISFEEYDQIESKLDDIYEFIIDVNESALLDDDKYAKIQRIGRMKYDFEDGSSLRFITEEELDCLSIRKGTLTEKERSIMESHVKMTEKILSKVKFQKQFKDVPIFAAQHHELLDGSGYPNHLTAEDLPLESRILTIVDIYDALTSADRPYKEPVSKKSAFVILHSMAKEGKLEERLVMYLENALKHVTDDMIIEATNKF